MPIFAGKSSPLSPSSSSFRRVGVYPIVAERYGIDSAGLADRQAAQAGARSQGRRAPGAARADRRCAAARDRAGDRSGCARSLSKAAITARPSRRPTPTHFRVEGVPPAQDAAFRTAAAEVQTNFDRSAGTGGTYTFTMKPNIQVTLREEAVDAGAADDRAPRQRARRHRAEHRPAGTGRRSDPRAAARRHRRRAGEGDHPVDRPARAEDRRAGTGGHARSAAGERSGPAGHGDRARALRRRATRAAARSTTWCAGRPRSPARICGTRGRRSTRTTSRRSASR